MMSFDGLSPQLVWGLFPRLVGVIYILGFGALIPQIRVLAGSTGYIPIRAWLARVRRDFPGVRRFFDYPTLLWLNDSEAMLRSIPVVGALCGAAAVYGGPIGWWALLLGWVLWLSIEPAGIIFPWDTMLMEVGFLVLFLPIVAPLPELTATALPLPSVAFVIRWLLLRLMLGFGKDKFLGASKSDNLYLRGFFVWMPLPTPLGWLGHHAPAWFLKASLGFMFFAEVIAPILGFFAGPLRLVSFAALVGLSIGIHATGNWGFFNVAYALLCVCLLDVHSSIFDLGRQPWASSWSQWPDLGIHALMAALFLGSLIYLPLNTWTTRTWVHWPKNIFIWEKKRMQLVSKLHHALAPLRLIAPFRLINGYGVFPPQASPPLRIIPVLEGSRDQGLTWKQYGYRRMPTFPKEAPPFIAPYHSRLDQWAYYMGNGIHSGSLFGSLLPYGNPYFVYTRSSWLDLIVQRVLVDDPVTKRALGHNPFPDAPPTLVRIGVVALTPTRPSELRKTGHWWHVRRLGTLVPARGVESWPDRYILPEPELFHPDYVELKRRARTLRAVSEAYERSRDADQAVIAGSDLDASDVQRFWGELVPMLAQQRGDWSAVHERAAAIGGRFDVDALHRLERVLERFAWLLRLRTEPHHLGNAKPKIALSSNFRYHMLLHEIIADGRESYRGALEAPIRAVDRARRTSDASQLWVLTLMRYEQMMAHLSAFRWCEIGLRGHEQGLPGLFEYYHFLIQQIPPDEEFCPHPIKHANGEHTIEGFYPPPPLAPKRS
jgi:lipase maturation factor 1